MTVFDGGDGDRDRRERARALVTAAATDLDGSDDAPGLGRDLQAVCRAATDHLAMLGAVVNLMTRAGADYVAASSGAFGMRIGDLSFAVGEGPCVDAFAHARPVLVPDLAAASGTRWFAYAPAALGLHVRAVFCLPLHVGAVRLGVLEAYSDRPRALDKEEIAMLLNFATIATEMLLASHAEEPERTLGGRLNVELDDRAEIYQAQGMVMVDLRVDLAEALIRMRAYAFSRDEALIDVARTIIAGQALPEDARP